MFIRVAIPVYSGIYSGAVNTDSIQITPELLALMSEIDEFKGAWRLLGTLAPERLNALRRVATIESVGSSTRIEGSKLTDREVEQLLSIHPLLIVALFIVNFLEIHPFQDGNGRLSRILTTLLLLQAGYVYVPYSSLESVIENSKESYYLALRQTQTTIQDEAPDWQPWLMFFMRALQQQKRRLSMKVEYEKNTLITLSELAIKILDYVRNHGRATTREMVRQTGASPNTLKATFSNLVEKRLLVRHGGGRSTWYSLS